jgi:dTDP-4-dehydrorhamnose 3,5-epimerase
MQFKHSHIQGLIEVFPRIFEDDRGFFFESYQQKAFSENGIPVNFVQDNQSFSKKGVLRGLHFQKEPYAQGKLVRVVVGKALDVAVDLRPDSPTFGKYDTFLLDSVRNNMVYVPAGFAHGFVALEDTVLQYKCTNLYNKAAESGIIWSDKYLSIHWGITDPIISEKDAILPNMESLFQIRQR